jgi:hypothetical protein
VPRPPGVVGRGLPDLTVADDLSENRPGAVVLETIIHRRVGPSRVRRIRLYGMPKPLPEIPGRGFELRGVFTSGPQQRRLKPLKIASHSPADRFPTLGAGRYVQPPGVVGRMLLQVPDVIPLNFFL